MKAPKPQSAAPVIRAAALPEGVEPPAGNGVLLEAWMDSQAGAICRGEWEGWPPAGSFDLLEDAVKSAGADEGALWLVDDVKRELRPCLSVGGHADVFLNEIRQPLSSGLISMVFFTENSIFEAEVGRRSEYCPDVDSRLGLKTKAMIAMPVFFAQRCRGVFSAVLFDQGGASVRKSAFLQADFEILAQAAALWSELMDSQLAGVGMHIGGAVGK